MAKRKFSIPFLKRVAAATTRIGGKETADFSKLIQIIEDKADRWGDNFIREDGSLDPDPWPYKDRITGELLTGELAGSARDWAKDYNDLVMITELLGDDVRFIRKKQSWIGDLAASFDPLIPGHQTRWVLDTSTLNEEFQGDTGTQNFAFQGFREDLFAQYADTRRILEELNSLGYNFEALGKEKVDHSLYDELQIGGVDADVQALIQNYMGMNSVFYAEELLDGEEGLTHLDQILGQVEQLYKYYEAKAREEIGYLDGEDLEAFRTELQEEYDAGETQSEELLQTFEREKGVLSLDSAREINVIQHANALVTIGQTNNVFAKDTALGATLEGIEWEGKWDFSGITDKDAKVTELPTSTWDAILLEPTLYLGQGFDFGIEDTQLIAWLENEKPKIEEAWIAANKTAEFDESFDVWFSDNYTGTIREQINENNPTIYGGDRIDYILDPRIKEYVQDIPILNNMRGTVSDLIKNAVRTLRAQESTSEYQLTKTEAFEELISGKHPGINIGLIKRNYVSDLIYNLKGGSEFVEALNASDINLFDYMSGAGTLNNPTQWLQGIVNTAVVANPDILPGVGPNFVEDDVIAFTTMASTLLAGDPDFENGGLALKNAMRASLINQFRVEHGGSDIQGADISVFNKVYKSLSDNFAENQLREIIRGALPTGEAGAESPASRMIASLEKSAENKGITFIEAYQALGIDKSLDRGEVFNAVLYGEFEALELGPSEEELAELGLREQFEGFSESLIQTALNNIQYYIADNYPDQDLSDVLSGIDDVDKDTNKVINSRDVVEAFMDRMLRMTENTWAGQNEEDRELLLAIAKSYSTAEDESGVRTFVKQFPELTGMAPNIMVAEIGGDLGRYTKAGADTTAIDELMIDRGIIESLEEASIVRQQEQTARDLLTREVEAGYRDKLQDIDPSLFRGVLSSIEDIIYQKDMTFTQAMADELTVNAISDEISEIKEEFALAEEMKDYKDEMDALQLEGKDANLQAEKLRQKALELENERLIRAQAFEDTDAAKNLRLLEERQELRARFGDVFSTTLQKQIYGQLSGAGAEMVYADVGAKLRADYTNIALAYAGLQAEGDITAYGASDVMIPTERTYREEEGEEVFAGYAPVTTPPTPQEYLAQLDLGEDYFRQQLQESKLRRRPVRSGIAKDITRQTQGPKFTPFRI